MIKFRWMMPVAAIAVTLVLASCSASSPEATIKGFYKAVAAGKVADATSHFAFETFKSNEERGLAKSKVTSVILEKKSEVDDKGGLDSVEITDVEKSDDDHAIVKYTVHFKDGDTNKGRDKVIRVDGKWLIDIR